MLEALLFQALEPIWRHIPRDRKPRFKLLTCFRYASWGLRMAVSLCSLTSTFSLLGLLPVLLMATSLQTSWAVLSSDRELLASNSWWRLFSLRTSARVYDCPDLLWPAVSLFTEPAHILYHDCWSQDVSSGKAWQRSSFVRRGSYSREVRP